MTTNRPLRVFLCHSSNDKPAVRELYQQLRTEPWIQPWLDEEELYPGQDWNFEIETAVEAADAILVCLSNNSVTKEGYVQREIRIVLDYADYKPEGTLYVIPVRLEACTPPRRLARWQYADYFEGQRERAFQRLLISLKRHAEGLSLQIDGPATKLAEDEPKAAVVITSSLEVKKIPAQPKTEDKNSDFDQFGHPTQEWIAANKISLSNGMELMRVPAGKFLMGSKPEGTYDKEKPQHIIDIPYDYWIARFPVTNELYNAYVKSQGMKHPVSGWNWGNKKDHPVTFIVWMDAMRYCQWLSSLLKNELSSGLVLRLPTEAEWEKAARGTDGRGYPWGNEFDKNLCNSREGKKGGTTPVGFYSSYGDSPYGCADMAGNVWEWTHSLMKPYPYKVNDGREREITSDAHVLRGSSFGDDGRNARCAFRLSYDSGYTYLNYLGFRVVAAPPLPDR